MGWIVGTARVAREGRTRIFPVCPFLPMVEWDGVDRLARVECIPSVSGHSHCSGITLGYSQCTSHSHVSKVQWKRWLWDIPRVSYPRAQFPPMVWEFQLDVCWQCWTTMLVAHDISLAFLSTEASDASLSQLHLLRCHPQYRWPAKGPGPGARATYIRS